MAEKGTCYCQKHREGDKNYAGWGRTMYTACQEIKRTRPNKLVAVSFMLLMTAIIFCGHQFSDWKENNYFELPDCHEVLSVFKEFEYEVCEWEVDQDDGAKEYKIRLTADDKVIAEIEIERLNIKGVADFEGSGIDDGWSTYIDVESDFRNSDLGELMWKLGDKFIKRKYGSGQVRIYIDSSTTNPYFSQKIKRMANPFFTSADGADFIYVIQ